uniref:Putative tail protein n=1 Tax=viral metagenome TaxID=1070528 RepID=A0A6M3KR47_9ZZZZ
MFHAENHLFYRLTSKALSTNSFNTCSKEYAGLTYPMIRDSIETDTFETVHIDTTYISIIMELDSSILFVSDVNFDSIAKFADTIYVDFIRSDSTNYISFYDSVYFHQPVVVGSVYIDSLDARTATIDSAFIDIARIDSLDADSIDADYIYVDKLTDGTFTVESGAFTGVASISDGTASWSSSSLSGFVDGTFTGDLSAEDITASDTVYGAVVQGTTVNAMTTIKLNNVDINTAGTLTNVAYLNQENTFTDTNIYNSHTASKFLALDANKRIINRDETDPVWVADSSAFLNRNDFADSLKNCHDTISASVIHACSKLDIDADTITGQPVWTGDFRLTGGQIRASSVPLVLSTENVGDIELAPVSGDSIFLDASGAGITYIQSSAMIEEHLKFTDNNTEIFKSVATNDLVFQDINSGLIKLATLDTGRVSTSGDDIYGNINITSKKAYKQNNVNLIRIPSGSETSLCIGNSGNNTFYKKNNTLIGDSAGYSLNTGQRNTFIGSLAGQYCDSTDNLFIGIGAGRYRNVNNNIGIGYVALRGAVGTATGNFNTALGNYAGYNTTTGTDNVFIGYDAGANNNTGYYNVYIGNYAGYAGTTANNNMAFGRSAMNYVTTGYENVAIGSNSLVYNQAGLFNVAIGSSAMYGVSGNSCTRNTIIGYKGAYLVRTAQYNTGIGYQVFYNINNGEANSAVGFNAGNSLTTGNYNCYFGRDAGFSNQTGASNVFIGYQAGYSETGSNKLYIDNSNTATPLIYGDFSADYLKINGGEKAKNNIYTTTQVLNHANNFVYADGTSGAVDITLPTGTIYNETVYYIKCINADNTVRIVADGADTIDGAATVTLALNDSYILQYIFSKNKWYIF